MSTAPTAFITGANNGIGLELTRKMLAEGWQVIALIRSAFPEEDDLFKKSEKTKQLRVYRIADLTNYPSLKQALLQIKAAENTIDLLFNNAGGSFSELSYSPQGREMHFELQTVVPYILLMELKPLLMNGNMKTVINTSSSATKMVKALDPNALERPATFKKLLGPYATSKLALTLWTKEAASTLMADGIKLLSVDPGSNNTLRKDKPSGLPFYAKFLMKYVFGPPSRGASLLYHAAVGAKQFKSGSFIINGRVTEPKFPEKGPEVYRKVRSIYEKEFAS
jgi:NAD(P)-dependent dehydrogenase (short-subunit alcohol dehydrogenase family)